MKIDSLFMKCECRFWGNFNNNVLEYKCDYCPIKWKREIKEIPGGMAVYIFKDSKS